MQFRFHAVLTGMLAALALAAAVGSASANRLSSSSLTWRHTWAPIRFIAGSSTVSCNLTVEGSFHSSVSQKVADALSGFATRLAINTCTGGSATLLSETLPWHYTYTGFTGVLPRIASVTNNLIGASFRIQPTGSLACLARMTLEHPGKSISTIEANGAAPELRAAEEVEIPLTGEGGLCFFAGMGHFAGTARLTVLGSTTLITVRLI